MHYVSLKKIIKKKKLTKFKTLSNNKYKQLNLENNQNIIYCTKYTLLENNDII